jgi:hypothetical protein
MATPEEIAALEEDRKSDPANADIKAMLEEIKRLKQENEEFKKRQRPVTFSVTDKGGVSVHGIGKFPFTLYRAQWERVLDKADDLRAFMREHAVELN